MGSSIVSREMCIGERKARRMAKQEELRWSISEDQDGQSERTKKANQDGSRWSIRTDQDGQSGRIKMVNQDGSRWSISTVQDVQSVRIKMSSPPAPCRSTCPDQYSQSLLTHILYRLLTRYITSSLHYH